MSNKDYGALIKKATVELKGVGEGRRLEQLERLQKHHKLTKADAEIILKHGFHKSTTPRRTDDIAGEEFHTLAVTVAKNAQLPAARAFNLTGLDPFLPNDWLYLIDALASIVLRDPRPETRDRKFENRLKTDVRLVLETDSSITMTELVMALHAMDKKTYSMSEPTLRNYIRKAGIIGLARESKYKKPRKLVVTRPRGK